MFTPPEAQVALAIPTALAPFQTADQETIAANCGLPRQQVIQALEAMDAKAMLYTALSSGGKKGYALFQVG